MPRSKKQSKQPALPGTAKAAKDIREKNKKELLDEILRAHVNQTTSSERGEDGRVVVTAYATIVSAHQFRRNEAALLCGKEVCLCPTGLETPEVMAHLKQVNCTAGDGKSSEPRVAMTLVGDKALEKLLTKDVDIYEVEEEEEGEAEPAEAAEPDEEEEVEGL